MSEISKEKMLRQYRYATNTTKSAIERKLPVKELPCLLCGNPITQTDVDRDNCEATCTKGHWTFFHTECANRKLQQ